MPPLESPRALRRRREEERQGEEQEPGPACFLCLAPCSQLCPHCGVVYYCGEHHLDLHRSLTLGLALNSCTNCSRHQGECLPFRAGRLADKGRVLFATRDLR